MKVAVIGAGTMGRGIAQAFAQCEGYEVCLCDLNEILAGRGKKRIAANLQKRVNKGKMTQEECDAILNKIRNTPERQEIDPLLDEIEELLKGDD